jgi:hypothetical protein
MKTTDQTKANRAARAQGKATKQPTKEGRTTTKTPKQEKATAWAMGRITPKGMEILLVGDHNQIEAASAKVNKDAGMRVAFVVDVRALSAKQLQAAISQPETHVPPATSDEGEGEEEGAA